MPSQGWGGKEAVFKFTMDDQHVLGEKFLVNVVHVNFNDFIKFSEESLLNTESQL